MGRRLIAMTLNEIINDIRSHDRDSTIYAGKEWSGSSPAVVEIEPDDGGRPDTAKDIGAVYFLEISIAQDIFALFMKYPNKHSISILDTVIYYAVNDAYYPGLP